MFFFKQDNGKISAISDQKWNFYWGFRHGKKTERMYGRSATDH
jgi:hypothetical protein